MSIRITGGVARGRVLRGRVRQGIRPTGARMREAWFSIVGQDLSGVRFLDAFAGSGVMGLEAWSRGAEVTCVEKDRRAARDIGMRIEELGAQVLVRTGAVERVVPMLERFDLVFADPPYAMDPGPALAVLCTIAPRVCIETAHGREMPPMVAGLAHMRTRTFGSAVVHFYEEGTSNDAPSRSRCSR